MAKRSQIITVIFGVLLVALIGGTLWMNYKAQVSLQKSTIAQLRQDAQRQAINLEYFFYERKDDVKDLAKSREISVFFANKALGMSMAYGLRASLVSIAKKFEEVLAFKRFYDDPVYTRLLFLDDTGKVLVDTDPVGDTKSDDSRWSDYLTPGAKEIVIFENTHENALRTIIAAGYYFKNKYAGQVIAVLSQRIVFNHLLKPRSDHPHRRLGLLCQHGFFHYGEFDKVPFFAGQAYGGTGSGMYRVDGFFQEQSLAVQIPVKDTPFSIVIIMQLASILGGSAPWHLPLFMGILSVMVLGGIVMLWRSNTQNAILNTRLEETVKRESAIENQNIQMESEINERRRVEEALRFSRRRLDLALKGGDLGIWDWNVANGNLVVDHRCTEMLGYELEEIEPHARSWKKLLHPEDMPWVLDAFKAHLDGHTPFYETEHRLKTKSGGWKWVMDRGLVVERDESGTPLRMTGTHLNVNARKTAELEVKKYQDNLELLVEQRTRDLKEAQSELVNKAMEAGRAQLSAMVLHNIGNALTPINVFLTGMCENDTYRSMSYLHKCYDEMLAQKDNLSVFLTQSQRGQEIFTFMGKLITDLEGSCKKNRQIKRKIEGAVAYISEIISMQRTYAASGHEMKRQIDLNDLIEDAIRMQAGALDKRGIIVKKVFDTNLSKLIIDQNRLMQVLVNIIKNGYEAIDQLNGGAPEKRMTFNTFAVKDGIGLSISDNGIGVDPEIAPRLFEFGHSGKGSSGFGLYYCKMFVDANHGTMAIESPHAGQGTNVIIQFNSSESTGDTQTAALNPDPAS